MNASLYYFKTFPKGKIWHFDLLEEFLYNDGAHAYKGIDHIRLYHLWDINNTISDMVLQFGLSII